MSRETLRVLAMLAGLLGFEDVREQLQHLALARLLRSM
jgi:hypothetical protein